ncbi:hypothetical protein Q3G72_012487 [Acer saccharum]|nr:hypothetical protein Q3G72_012487 [Acer saccharum]
MGKTDVRDNLPSRQAQDTCRHAVSLKHHFSDFKSKFKKTYATQGEHDFRFGVFQANLRRAKRHQMLNPFAVQGVTKFSDLTPSPSKFSSNSSSKPPADDDDKLVMNVAGEVDGR